MKSILLSLVTLGGLGLAFGFTTPSTRGGLPAPKAESEATALEAWVGTWTAEMDVAGQKSTGKEVCRLDVGGSWLISDFEGEVMGSDFEGHGVMGYDPAKQKFVSVWIDSVAPALSVGEGTLSADGKTLTLISDGRDMQGNPVTYEMVTAFDSADTRVFKLSEVRRDGTRILGMTITYTKQE